MQPIANFMFSASEMQVFRLLLRNLLVRLRFNVLQECIEHGATHRYVVVAGLAVGLCEKHFVRETLSWLTPATSNNRVSKSGAFTYFLKLRSAVIDISPREKTWIGPLSPEIQTAHERIAEKDSWQLPSQSSGLAPSPRPRGTPGKSIYKTVGTSIDSDVQIRQINHLVNCDRWGVQGDGGKQRPKLRGANHPID